MNLNGQPHSNREFKGVLRSVARQLRDDAPPRVVRMVIEGMVRHENRKRRSAGDWRGEVPRKIIDSALHLLDRRLKAAS